MAASLVWFALAVIASPTREARPQQNGSAAEAVVDVRRRATDEAPAFWLRYEWRRDRFRYRFENPSSFNTTTPVPHYFEQTYRGDNHWAVAGARYPLFGAIAETEFGVTTERVTVGADYDTFFQPDGNTVLYGTTADVSMRSHRVSQRLESREMGGWRARIGYSYQRDRSIFHPSPSTTTQTRPPSFSSFWNPARETTISEVHEILFGAARRLVLSRGWTVLGVADVAPVRLAKLTTILPDKYPGQDIVFLSKGMSISPRVDARWVHGRCAVDLSVAYYTTWNYLASDQFHRNVIGAGVRVTFSPGRRGAGPGAEVTPSVRCGKSTTKTKR